MPSPETILRIQPSAPDGPVAGRAVLILDTTWTSAGEPGLVGLREVAGRVLGTRDVIAETSEHLDAWADAAGVVDALTVEGTSFWYYHRVGTWLWLQERIIWVAILDDVLAGRSVEAIELAPDLDVGLVAAARLMAAHKGRPCREETTPEPAETADEAAGIAVRLRGLLGRSAPSDATIRKERTRRRALVAERLEALSSEPGRLLVVLEHARQRVETADGPRLMNPYLGPIVDVLRGGPLEPIEIDIRAKVVDDEAWASMNAPEAARRLPVDALALVGPDDDADHAVAGERAAAAIEASSVSVLVSGVDLAPSLRAEVAARVRSGFAGRIRSVGRIRRLLARLNPAGILLADEYHRPDWLAAAAAEGVPSVAVQHGMIYRWHNGYMHRSRPAGLRLPTRTYVFGRWERDLLTRTSVYREDEVRVGGSPRLQTVTLQGSESSAEAREAMRAELGVAPGERVVVLSGTWGPIHRRFLYPISLARLFDRPMPNVRVVVKLHPGEPDEGPYRAIIEGVASAGGFVAPPITVVQRIDLYRLLSAADAHLGVQSTVLTEAVATGTPNLLADTFAGSDLLGYVAAGVATPVRTGADLLAALDHPAPASEEARRAFLEAHLEPGPAATRIARELEAWPA